MAGPDVALRPFFTYYGGKYRIAPRYPAPRYSDIVEPFAGSAGYSLRHPDRNVTLVDMDENIVQTWQYLIGVSADEIRALPDLAPWETVADIDVAPEARLLIGWWLNKGSAAPCRTPSAWMRAGTHVNSFWGATIRERIASQVDRIRHWQITQGSYADVDDRPATWFVDPPYQDAGRHYRRGASDIDFGHLAEWCMSRTGQVIACEADAAAWLPFRDFVGMKGTTGRQKASPARREVVWMNDEMDDAA